jgi:hypothetical protein
MGEERGLGKRARGRVSAASVNSTMLGDLSPLYENALPYPVLPLKFTFSTA